MPGNLTNSLVEDILRHLIRSRTWTAPSNLYVAALLAEPTNSGTYSEPTDASYARVLASSWSLLGDDGRGIEPSTDLTFPDPSVDWGVITHWGLFDFSTRGTLLAWGPITQPEDISVGDVLKFPKGDISIVFDS